MKLITTLFYLSLLLLAPQAHSRDTKHMMSIQDAMESANYQEKLDPDVALYFGDQSHPKVEKSFGSFPTNKKTNSFNKSDEAACQWVMLSALLALQERAKREGGNAVINISSYYKKNVVKSETEFECHAGAFMSGVALKGEVVKLSE